MSEQKRFFTTSKRQGRLTQRQQVIIENQLGHEFVVLPDDVSQWVRDKENPVIEVGFGMGKSLYEMAQLNPHESYLGIDVYKPGVAALLNLLIEQPLTNLHVVHADALSIFAGLPSCSLARIQCFFPDPWPKKRHRKRRIIHTDFLQMACRALRRQGYFYVITDWQDYADDLYQTVDQSWTRVEHSLGIERPCTKYESRGRALGHQIYHCLFQKN